MSHAAHFAEVLEAVDQLSAEEQVELFEIVRRRASERGRQRLAAEAREAQVEFAEGRCRPASVDEIMGEVLA